jgi:branched-chain amino acid transport system substrate-binding protein
VTEVDDALNPATAISGVKSLLQQPNLVAIVDNSGVDSEWATYPDTAKVPVIGMGIDQSTFFTDANFYPEGQTQDIVPTGVAIAAKKVGSPKFAMFYCAEAPVCAQLITPQKQAAKDVGTDLVYSAAISASASSYAAQCLAAQQAGANAIAVYDSTAVVRLVGSSCSQQGYHPHIIVDNFGSMPQNGVGSAGLSTGLIGTVPDLPLSATNVPEVKTMTQAFNKYDPGLTTNPDYNEQALSSWATGIMLTDAAKGGSFGSSGSATSAQLTAGLHTIKNDTLDGLAPKLTFKAGQPNPIHCWFWETTKNGKWILPYGTTTTCGSINQS